MDLSEYLSLFLDESRENLQTLNASLLDLERDPQDPEALQVIFRVAHSLKGMSATMGFDRMAKLTHRMEEVLSALRDGEAPVTTDTVDTLFACLDLLEAMVNDIADGAGERTDTAAIMARLDACVTGAAAPAPADAAPPPPPTADDGGFSDYERVVVADAREAGRGVFRVAVSLREDCMLRAARAYMVIAEMERAGEIIKADPPRERIEHEEFGLAFTLWVVTDLPAGEIEAAVSRVSEVEACEVGVAGGSEPAPAPPAEPVAETPAAPPPAAASPGPADAPAHEDHPAPGHRKPRQQNTVRVGTDRLDSLMNLMGEMVIQRTRLTQLAADHDLPDLRTTVEEVTRVTNDLQNLVMQVRMMPVETVFMRFPRMVRDLAQSLGKHLDLVITGEDTELDRTVIDELGDPLVHMLRNAVDHGLETPEERRAAGKPETGTVRLSARHEGSSVVIEVEEDGRGIDPARIRDVAVAKGVLAREDADQLTDQEAVDLIFAPGLSTAKVATDVSGRGVGMDAVRTKINGLNGTVEIHSELGAGSRFVIRLPLTLAIIQALLVRSAGETYALPLEAIDETVVVRREETRPVNGRECMVLRDRVVPLVRLREQLALAGEDDQGDALPVVVVRSGGTRLGVVVDHLVGQQDIVIKHLPSFLGDVVGVAGATILGDGRVALIVDVGSLSQPRGVML
ncbi:MAG: chemotaxis protein CheA [Thermoleophilia bacterium]|nr:chemotaxis protein CheA [Thermoleophilia bacterium]